MNYYKDGSDYIEGYNPIVTLQHDQILQHGQVEIEEYDQINCIDYVDCLFDNPPENCTNYTCPLHV